MTGRKLRDKLDELEDDELDFEFGFYQDGEGTWKPMLYIDLQCYYHKKGGWEGRIVGCT